MSSILISGGAGFFAKAFVRRLLQTPDDGGGDRICIYSRNEWNQAQMRAEMKDDPRLRWWIGDVRDSDRLRRAMESVDIVIHAAAMKRIEAVESNIMEAVTTNVIGTENVVKAGIDAGLYKAILLSTDKACQPTTTYGLTKAMAEAIFLNAHHYAGRNGPKYVVCRYGNIASSTGSLIPIWRKLIANGQTELPCTNPDATRFWMTADQAVDLVIDAINHGGPGDMLIPNLPAYDLRTMAEALGATGLIPMPMSKGEKIAEQMLADGPDSSQVRRMSVDELREALTHV